MASITDSALLGAAGASSGGGGRPYTGDLAVSLGASPYLRVYEWSPSGFGSAYSDPTSTTNRSAARVDWSPDNTVIVSGGQAWAWSASGFGAKYTDNTITPTAGVQFNPSGTYLITCGDSINIALTAWSNSTGFGTRYTLPSAFGVNIGNGCFNSAGNVVGFVAYDGVGLQVYPWNSPGFGSRFTNPPSNTYLRAISFNPTDSVIFLGKNSSPFLTAYAWSNSTGFGSQYSNPSVLPTGYSRSGTLTVSPNGDAVCIGSNSSPYFAGYSWSDVTGFGVKYSDPSSISFPPNGAQFSPDGNFIAVVGAALNFLKVYPFDSTLGFGAPVSDPVSLPGTYCIDCTFRRPLP